MYLKISQRRMAEKIPYFRLEEGCLKGGDQN